MAYKSGAKLVDASMPASESNSVEFSPPSNWRPQEDSKSEDGTMEAIVTYKLKDGKICVYSFDGEPIGEGKSAAPDEGTADSAPDPFQNVDVGMEGGENG